MAAFIGRREFITLLGGAAAWPLAAGAQQAERVRRIGVLMGIANDSEGQARMAVFRKTMESLGWIEGRNLQLDYRWAPIAAGARVRRRISPAKARPDILPFYFSDHGSQKRRGDDTSGLRASY